MVVIIAIIAIVVLVLIALVLVAVCVGRRLEQGGSCASGWRQEATEHRQEADAHASRGQRLAPEADALRRKATEHAAVAEKEAARARGVGHPSHACRETDFPRGP